MFRSSLFSKAIRCAYRSLLHNRGISLPSATRRSGSYLTGPSNNAAQQGSKGYPWFAANVLRPSIFCLGGSAAAFTGAALADERRRERLVQEGLQRYKRSSQWLFGQRPAEPAAGWLPGPLQRVATDVQGWWSGLDRSQKCIYTITGLNGLVFLAWRLPGAGLIMNRYFLQTLPPGRLRVVTLFTSMFSHVAPLHLAFNMYALNNFGIHVCDQLGVEQFAALYLSAGLASALASHLGRLGAVVGGMSLGASGAIYACVAVRAVQAPDQQVVFIFLPHLPFALGQLLPCAMALEVVGILMRWRTLDHWGHLGGAVFGWLYATYGADYVWANRERWLHPLRAK